MKLQPTPARVIARLDVAPKSILYHARREAFADRLFPSSYPNWEIGNAVLRLRNHPDRRRLSLEAGAIVFEADVTGETWRPFLRKHVVNVFTDYLKQVVPSSKPMRFGCRTFFVLEGHSFDDLFPRVHKATLDRQGVDWWRVKGWSPRDSAINLYYGLPEEGFNLSLGVLSPQQAGQFMNPLEFKGAENCLDISEGALLIDLDRYTRLFKARDWLAAAIREQDKMLLVAQSLVQRLAGGEG
ncbi:MAG: hypothetical protein R2909_06900 [Gemmatimonadales bacterium]